MRGAGILIAAIGLVLAARSLQLLTGRGRPRRGPQPAFVVAGPYVRIRNPLYAGAVLTVAGLAITAGSVVLGLVATAIAAAAHVWVVRREEPQLTARFGRAYGEYLRRVPRWIPKLRGSLG